MQRNDSMSQNVHLTLTGRQKDETGETALTRHSCSAEYFEKNDSVYLCTMCQKLFRFCS